MKVYTTRNVLSFHPSSFFAPASNLRHPHGVANIRSSLIHPRTFIDKEGADTVAEESIIISDYYGEGQCIAEMLQGFPILTPSVATSVMPTFAPTTLELPTLVVRIPGSCGWALDVITPCISVGRSYRMSTYRG